MSRHPIFERMRSDHSKVLERIAALESAIMGERERGASRAERDAVIREVVELLRAQFSTHMAAEDEVLYPALAEALPETRSSIEPLRADHAELRSMLDRLAATVTKPARGSRDEDIAVQARDLIDLLRIHIRKEEAVVLSVAERVLEPREIAALGARMSARSQNDRSPGPPPGGPKGVRK
jgi:hemerythrin-like domain-containing protein